MLLQTEVTEPSTLLRQPSSISLLHLLPALPKAWPTGKVTGLRARGGFEVDMKWKDGRLEEATIRSISGTACKVRYAENVVELNVKPGHTVALDGALKIK
jgi:alpha-L-fucosidase 2